MQKTSGRETSKHMSIETPFSLLHFKPWSDSEASNTNNFPNMAKAPSIMIDFKMAGLQARKKNMSFTTQSP